MGDEDIISVSVASSPYGVQIGHQILITHSPDTCKDDPACCIHKPSNHHMVTWPQNWRDDRGLMERICPHGIGHPDPDDMAHKDRLYGESHGYDVHGCDGCCRAPKEDTDAH